jgi:hypothetical protein
MTKHTYLVRPDGIQAWYQDDELHRLDGPAVIGPGGDKHWFQNGQRHRIDGPAVEYADGDRQWFQDDQRHRLDGPAIEYIDGSKFWFIKGIDVTEEVKLWIEENDIPKDHNKWTDEHCILFKLTWI